MSIFNYLLAASAGIEVGSFNIAYICELNPNDLITQYLNSTWCMWKYFNQSIYSDLNQANAYALIKMADYHYYKSKEMSNCDDSEDLKKAVEFYAMAYKQGEAEVNYSIYKL